MFRVICTGLNLNYGKENEERLLNDTHTIVALKRKWIQPDVRYEGDGRPETQVLNQIQKSGIQKELTLCITKK